MEWVLYLAFQHKMLRKLRQKNKRAAMEMSVGTIVTIVLLMSVLILGLVFIRKIMCSGISLTEDIDEKIRGQLINLFGTDKYGVECMGEAGQDIKLGDGGQRQFICVINVKEETEYDFYVDSVTSLGGVSTTNVKNWIIKEGWEGTAAAGNPKTVVPLILKIPEDVSETVLDIEITVTNQNTGSKDTHNSVVTVTPVSGINTAVC